MPFSLHFTLLCLFAIALVLQYQLARRLPESCRRNAFTRVALAASTVLLVLGYAFEFRKANRYFGASLTTWLQCSALVESICLIGLSLAFGTWRAAPRFQSTRRNFLRAAGASFCAAPVVGTAFGILKHNRFQLAEVNIPVPNLPKDLDGLKIVQITDIHLSPFLSETEFARAIDMANETRAHLALVTGDLISRRGDPLDACLRQCARLKADAGVLGCLGNHETYANVEGYVTEQGRRLGIGFLRHQARLLRFGAAAINIAGVDYQRIHARYLKGAEKLVAPDALNILLSHNPDVFPVAAAQGYAVTIAGHTHGGQVDFELLHEHMSVARFYTPYVRGLYRQGASSVYVSSGLGTIGVPIRLGVPPEVSLLRLCAT